MQEDKKELEKLLEEKKKNAQEAEIREKRIQELKKKQQQEQEQKQKSEPVDAIVPGSDTLSKNAPQTKSAQQDANPIDKNNKDKDKDKDKKPKTPAPSEWEMVTKTPGRYGGRSLIIGAGLLWVLGASPLGIGLGVAFLAIGAGLLGKALYDKFSAPKPTPTNEEGKEGEKENTSTLSKANEMALAAGSWFMNALTTGYEAVKDLLPDKGKVGEEVEMVEMGEGSKNNTEEKGEDPDADYQVKMTKKTLEDMEETVDEEQEKNTKIDQKKDDKEENQPGLETATDPTKSADPEKKSALQLKPGGFGTGGE